LSVFVIRSVLVIGTLAVHGNASGGIVCVGLQASLARISHEGIKESG